MGSIIRFGLVAAALALLAVGCGGTDAESSTTVAPSSTTLGTTTTLSSTTTVAPSSTTTIAAQPTTQEVLDLAAESVRLPDGVGSVLVAIVSADGTVTYSARGESPDGATLMPSDFVRIGSVTKTLTAATVLSLVESGSVDLDAPADTYVTRVPVDPAVTVRDLLQHTSGIPDYTQSDEFFIEVYQDTERVWTPEEAVAFVAGESDFDPGTSWWYSNTNYVILGVLVEEVTAQPFHDVQRSVLLEPASADGIYLAHFESGTEPVGSYTARGPAIVPVDFDFTSIATAAWASGAMVSDVPQLASTLTSLFAGEIVAPELVDSMTTPVEWETTFYGIPAAYGFGVFQLSDTQLAHDGVIPGFVTVYAHDTSTGATAIWAVSNQGASIPRPSFAEVLALLAEG